MEISHSCRNFRWVIVLLLSLSSSVPQGAVHADLGLPLINPSGASLEAPKGERTNVRMVEEEVNLTIEALDRDNPASGGYHMRGRVEAVFLMRNLGSSDEALEVWFPLETSVCYPGGLFNYPGNVVQDFKIRVDGHLISVQRVKGPDLGDPTQESLWASFPITFPAGKDVKVQVTYSLYPSGYGTLGSFEYILQTGADWKGTIGKAVIKVILPYPATKETVSLSGKSIDGLQLAPQPSGYIIENNVIRWEFFNLEPTAQDNIFVDVLEPKSYQNLLNARRRAAKQPDSADAQFALAEATRGALRVVKYVNENGGGADLAKQVNVAFRRALELAPDQEKIYVAYINWLMLTEGESSLMVDGTCPVEACDLLDRALKLFPDNADLINRDQEVRAMQADAAYRNQAATEQAATASAEAQPATDEASAATSLAQASKPTIMPTAPIPAATKAAPQPTIGTAASSPAPSHAFEATPVPQQAAQGPGQGLNVFWLPLVFILATAFMIWLARRR